VPIGGDPRGHDVALLRRLRCRLEQLGKRSGTVLAVEHTPGIDGARHGHRMRRLDGNFADPVLDIPLDRGLRRRAPGAVERQGQGAALRIEDKAVAADTGALRLDHTLHGRSGDRGVGRVAARAQHVERRQGGSRVRSGGHPVCRHRRRSSRNVEIAHCWFS